MFQKMSYKIANQMVREGVIDSKIINVYAYGFELLFSTVAGILVLVVISILGNEAFLWIPYLAGFIPIRLTGGGYHAHSHRNCIIAFATIYFVVFNTCRTSNSHIWLIASTINLVTMFLFSPVDAKNKPLREDQRKRKRTESLFLGVINLAPSFLIYALHLKSMEWINMYYAGSSMANLSLLVAVIINTLKKEE